MTFENPITVRLAQLHDQWVSFARTKDARLLVWSATVDELAVIDTFVAEECDGGSAQTPDLFIRLTAPFANETVHGRALAAAFQEQYIEVSRDDAESGEPGWRPPSAEYGEDDVAFLIRVMISLYRHQFEPDADARLVLWLDPGELSAPAAYLSWLQRLAHCAPNELRVLAVDLASEPTYEALVKAGPARVVARRCGLDMASALGALARSGGRNGPDHRFRILQTELAAAIDGRNLAACQHIGAAALQAAETAGSQELAASIHMMLAAALLGHGRLVEALARYAEVERIGAARERREREAAVSEAVPHYGLRLRLQARLGQGAALLSRSAYQHACAAYLSAAELARALQDARSELDGYRLASACCGELGDARAAWEYGMRGFQLGLALDQETRETSTLLYLADHLLRLTERHSAYASHRRPLEQQLTKLFGSNWRVQLAAAKAA